MILHSLWYQIFIVSVIGLLVGSFLNVLVLRTLKGESLITPASKCPQCGKSLMWWHNVPIVSYLILRGKCYFCNSKISIQYPLVELINTVLYVCLWLKYRTIESFILSSVICSLFLTLSVMDIKAKKISVKYSVLLILVALIFRYKILLSAICGGLVVVLALYIFKIFFDKIFETETIGFGDLYLVSTMGIIVGIKNLPIAFLLCCLTLAIIYFPQIIKKMINRKYYIYLLEMFIFIGLYILLFMNKIGLLCMSKNIKMLLIVNLIIVLCLVCKFLFKKIKNLEIVTICPFSPSIFLISLLFLFFN